METQNAINGNADIALKNFQINHIGKRMRRGRRAGNNQKEGMQITMDRRKSKGRKARNDILIVHE